jgi:2-isopropylmalate synthase
MLRVLLKTNRSKEMTDKLIIFDTTLRDGEQSPGASMTRDEKLRIARQLERLKVDVIEAGFAASSNGDFDAVQLIANNIKDSTICSLARANDRDISRAAEALKGGQQARIHTFIATSALHMEKKLRMTPDQVFEQAKQSVRFARNLVSDIEFSPEDGYRSDVDFLCRVIEAVIHEGATTINVPDTVGYAIPELYGNFIKTLRERIPNSDKADLVCALPQRSGHGGCQFTGGCQDWWRAAGRVHDQRAGRARRQLQSRRNSDGGQDAQGLFRP